MTNQIITSLHSPQVERVKALLGSRGKKMRREESVFIADGMQSLRSAVKPKIKSAPIIEKIFVTESGEIKIREEFGDDLIDSFDLVSVTEQVMAAMSDTESPQGMLALCRFKRLSQEDFYASTPSRIAFFWQIQDPGNAGTAIRTADACGFDGVLFSEGSVDIHSPKVVRSTAGSLWHIPIVEDVTLESIIKLQGATKYKVFAFDGSGEKSLLELGGEELKNQAIVAMFGNEARGLPTIPDSVTKIRIPMQGEAESLNVASAAAIALFHLGQAQNR